MKQRKFTSCYLLQIIRDHQSYDDYSEVAKLFKIHSEELD